MKKLIVWAITFIAVCLAFSACSCEHQYQEIITAEASCTAVGIKTFTCTLCQDSYTEQIAVTEHSFGQPYVSKISTCKTNGEVSAKCTRCNTIAVINMLDLAQHKYTSTIITAATCTSTGEMTYTCSVCNDTYNETISKTVHPYKSNVTTEATCTSAGEMIYTCSVCNDTYKEMIPALGHKWVDATCTEAKYCSSCDLTVGSALGHTTNNGICSRCNETINPYSIALKTNLPYTCNYRYSMTGASSSVQITRLLSATFSSSGDRLTVKLQGTIIDPVDSIGSAWVKVKLTCPDGTTRTKETLEYGDAGDTVVFYIYFFDLAGDAGEYIIEIQNYYI